MASLQYMMGRKTYQRPQAMLWANNPGQVVEDEDPESPTFGQNFYLPLGFEINSFAYDSDSPYEFLILSDDNRGAINIRPERIESRERMANGRMRSYYIADKMRISSSWDMLPSRSYAFNPDFNSEGKSPYRNDNSLEFTTDGGAGGVELSDWYNKYTGSFWVYLSYDKYTNFGGSGDDDRFLNLNKYSQVVEVFFDSFDYSIERRGGSNYDFWNINLSLEEA
jgi:hypothetical protein